MSVEDRPVEAGRGVMGVISALVVCISGRTLDTLCLPGLVWQAGGFALPFHIRRRSLLVLLWQAQCYGTLKNY